MSWIGVMIPRKCTRYIRETLNADSIIPARIHQGTTNVWGKYRKEMTDNFDFVRYRKRFLVETKFSVLKRRYGVDLKSRIYQIQKKEISCKIILANLDRFIQIVWIEVFYRAKKLTIGIYCIPSLFSKFYVSSRNFSFGNINVWKR